MKKKTPSGFRRDGRSKTRVRRAAAFLALPVVITAFGAKHWYDQRYWAGLVEEGLAGSAAAAIEPIMHFPDEIEESSGLAVSTQNPGLFWTHNDSGDDAVVYGVRPGRGVVAEVRFSGAAARDWEDMALGACFDDPAKPCIYVADTGDNFAVRPSVSVFVTEEPVLDMPTRAGNAPIVGLRAPVTGEPAAEAHVRRVVEPGWTAFELAYEGGPRDAEALAVTPDGDLLIVSKSAGASGLIRVNRVPRRVLRDRARAGDGEGPIVLADAETLPFAPPTDDDNVTSATVGGDGGELVVRTYLEAMFFRREGRTWAEARPSCFIGHAGPGGEAIDISPPGVIYLTREAVWGDPAELSRAECQPLRFR